MVLKKLKKAGAFTLALTLVIGTVQIPVDAAGDSNVIEKGENLSLPSVNTGETVRFCADYEQIIGEDGTVFTPLEDKVVKGFFETTGEDTETSVKTDEVTYTVRGEYEADPDANEKPAVIPELQEWHGKKGTFVLSAASKIVIASEDLRDVAEVFQEDYQEMTGMKIKEIKKGTKAEAKMCDFYFGLTEAENGLGKEGYTMDIDDFVSVEAETATGAYWATRSILQILKQTSGSMPKGLVRDYPKYEVRAFSLDVGRKPFTLEAVKEFAKNMSWYKMNSFQLHLSDNLIFTRDYATEEEAIEKAYAGFRLESEHIGSTGKSATSEDVYYTKDEFRSFIKDSRTIGIDIVPEFDMPAHALPFTRAFPEYMTYNGVNGPKGYLIEEINLTAEGATDWAKSIWQEYLDGDDPVFDEETTIHIGTDEFHGPTGIENANNFFRQFSDDMIEFVQDSGRKVRMWGSLSNKSGSVEVRSEGVQLNIWNTGYANPQNMYNLGFDLINTLESNYIVPASGYYGDYLSASTIYNTWQPNVIGNLTAKAGDDQLLGGCYAIWHDSVDTRGNGISQYDSFDRFYQPLPAYSAKLWGDAKDRDYSDFKEVVEKTGTAPGTTIYGDLDYLTSTVADFTFDDEVTADSSRNRFDLIKTENTEQTVVENNNKALRLKGNISYAETPEKLDLIGDGAVLTMRVKMDENAEGEQILCESKSECGAYGTYAFKASQRNTGKVGFSREGYDYSFNYTLTPGEWHTLKFVSGKDTVSLYVDDEFVDNNPDIYFDNNPETELSAKLSSHNITKISTMLVPLGRIGSKKGNSFQGEIDFITVTGTKEIVELKASACSEADPASYAIDGKTNTFWHSDYTNDKVLDDTEHNHWFKLTLEVPAVITGLKYLPRQNGPNGRIYEYSIEIEKPNGEKETVKNHETWAEGADEKTVTFDPIEAKTVTIQIYRSGGDANGYHGTIAEISLIKEEEKEYTKEELKSFLDLCGDDNYKKTDYADWSWYTFQQEKEKAQQVLESSSDTSDYRYVYLKLQQASQNLVALDFMEKTEKDCYNLTTAVAEAEEQLEMITDTEAKAALQAVIEKAKAALAQSGSGQEDLSDITATLGDMKNSPDKIVLIAAKSELNTVISDAKKKLSNTAGYTQASIKALQDAVTAAENLLANPDVTVKALESAAENLAKLSLVKEPSKQDTGLKDNDPFEKDGMKYQVVSASALTAKLVKGTDTAKLTIDTVSYDGKTYKIVEIGSAAFSGCKKKLKKVTIGPNVAVIGKNAFKGCKKLANVVIKNNSKLTKVGGGAFKKTSSKIKVKLPKNLKKNKKLKKQLKKAGIKKGL